MSVYSSKKKRFLSSSFILLLAVLLATATVNAVMDDWFNSLDTNHDGNINHDEFDAGLSKLSAAFHGTLPPSPKNNLYWSSLLSSGGSFWKGFTSSVAMIIATEIGDKTFFIAAVMSMRHDRSAVFGGAVLALIIMTILSSAMGLVLPQLVPRDYTHLLGGVLFLYFGVKLITESRQMEANRVSEELEEVEEELLVVGKKKRREEVEDDDDKKDEENNNKKKTPISSGSISPTTRKKATTWYSVFVQSLTLTFLAEWGDRSQIATIALAAAKNPIGVTVGGCLGHALCTGLAVIGGRMLAARISEKIVAFYGGCIFLVFGFHSIFFEI